MFKAGSIWHIYIARVRCQLRQYIYGIIYAKHKLSSLYLPYSAKIDTDRVEWYMGVLTPHIYEISVILPSFLQF